MTITHEESPPRAANTWEATRATKRLGNNTTSISDAQDFAQGLRRRRAAAFRLEPLADGYRDPLDRNPNQPGPSTYSLTDEERLAHAAELIDHGWQAWEIRARLAPPTRRTTAA